MATIAKFDSDGLADGTTVTLTTAGTGDEPWGSITGSPPTISATGPRSPRLRFNQASGSVSYVSWGSSKLGGTRSVWGFRAYAEFTAWHSLSWTFLHLYMDATAVLRIDFAGAGTGSGRIRIKDGNNVQYGESPLGLNTNTVYRIEVLFSNGAVTVNAYEGESLSVYTSVTGTIPLTSVNRLSIGPMDSTRTIEAFYVDDIRFTDTASEVGPAGTPAPATLSLWTGTEEVYIIGSPPA